MEQWINFIVCLRRKLKVSVEQRKVIFERKAELCDLRIPYRVSVSAVRGCETVLEGEKKEGSEGV